MRTLFTVLANRAFFLLVLWLVLNATIRPGCSVRSAPLPSLDSITQGLDTLARALR